jgi:pimeloyl-ACP methyl ester carboxylesterase
MEDWQMSRIAGFVERPVRSDLGVSVALDSGGGDAPPLVAFPGAGFPAVMLAARLAPLARERRLLVVESPGNPGLGLTTSPDPHSDDLATWGEVLLDALDVGKADLFGHSSGGWTALRIAWERSDRVRRLVLAAPAGIVRSRAPLRLVLRSFRWRFRRDETGARRVIQAVSGEDEPDPDLVAWTTLLARHARMAAPPPSLPPPVLRAVDHPVLVMVGERDPVFPARRLTAAARKHLPEVRVEVVPGAGHVLPIEAAGLVVSATTDFLA